MKRMTLVVIDGCRPDVLQAADTPNIDDLVAAGASTFAAKTVSPSITLPVHFSIFTSLDPSGHGVLTNTGRPNNYAHPFNVLTLAKSHGWNTAVFGNWEYLRELTPPGIMDCAFFIDNVRDPSGDRVVAAVAADYLATRPEGVAFVYLGALDQAGHTHGFGSDEYRRRLETADEALGVVLATLKESDPEPNIILLSDHGGHGHHHGEDRPENRTVPWIAAGPGIKQGWKIAGPVSVLDTAPTMARFMGIPAHPLWQGTSPREIWKES